MSKCVDYSDNSSSVLSPWDQRSRSHILKICQRIVMRISLSLIDGGSSYIVKRLLMVSRRKQRFYLGLRFCQSTDQWFPVYKWFPTLNVLLYGERSLNSNTNCIIFKAVQEFITHSKRFEN